MHQTNTLDAPLVTFSLNGRKVVTRADQTILQTADDHGIEVPRLCYMEGMRADGNCRTCMAEIKGERALLPRRAGQRRDRLRVPRRPLEDRVRPRRPDGRLDVCRVRRMRAGMPD